MKVHPPGRRRLSLRIRAPWAPGGLRLAGSLLLLSGCAVEGGGGPATPPALAVLPFETADGAPGAPAFFAAGLQADLIDILSRVDGLTVLSQASVASLVESRRERSDDDGADFSGMILDGRAERTSDRIRVDARLVPAGGGAPVWSESFDRGLTLDNVFRIQAEIAQQVATALRVALSPEDVAALDRPRANSLAAYDRYLEGRAHFARRFEISEALLAVSSFLQAQTVDPQFAAAHAAEAEARVWLFWYGGQADQADSARAALGRALELNESAVETRLARASFQYRVERDFDGARLLLETIQPEAPGNSDLHSMLGGIARRQGRWEDAVERFRRAQELDPARVGGAVTLAQTYRYLRRGPESLEWAERAVALDPASTRARAERVWTLVGLYGDTVSARRGLEGLSDEARIRSRARVVLLSPPADPAYYRRDFDASLDLWATTASALNQMVVSWVAGDTVAARRFAGVVATDWSREPVAEAEAPNIRASAMLYAGLARIILGDGPGGLFLGDGAVTLLTTDEDAFAGPRIEWMRALLSVAAGDAADAVARLEVLLERPSEMGPGQLRLNPWFDPLRGTEGFQRLVERTDAATTLR